MIHTFYPCACVVVAEEGAVAGASINPLMHALYPPDAICSTVKEHKNVHFSQMP